jgi:hypothetical protein
MGMPNNIYIHFTVLPDIFPRRAHYRLDRLRGGIGATEGEILGYPVHASLLLFLSTLIHLRSELTLLTHSVNVIILSQWLVWTTVLIFMAYAHLIRKTRFFVRIYRSPLPRDDSEMQRETQTEAQNQTEIEMQPVSAHERDGVIDEPS